jgi:hypothetical protein
MVDNALFEDTNKGNLEMVTPDPVQSRLKTKQKGGWYETTPGSCIWMADGAGVSVVRPCSRAKGRSPKR